MKNSKIPNNNDHSSDTVFASTVENDTLARRINLGKLEESFYFPKYFEMVILEEDRHEVDEWLIFWNDQVSADDRVYAKPAHTWGNQFGLETIDLVEQYAGSHCVSPFSTVIVQVDARIPLCGINYNAKMPLGDFAQQSIKDIWNNPAFINARLDHAIGKLNETAKCRGCHIWEQDLMVTEQASEATASLPSAVVAE